MRVTDWQLRILESVGWTADPQPADWQEFTAALYRHCTLREIGRALGMCPKNLGRNLTVPARPNHPRLLLLPTGEPLRHAAQRLGVPYNTAYARFRAGKRIDEAGTRGLRHLIGGRTIRALAAEAGVSYSTMWGRLKSARKI